MQIRDQGGDIRRTCGAVHRVFRTEHVHDARLGRGTVAQIPDTLGYPVKPQGRSPVAHNSSKAIALDMTQNPTKPFGFGWRCRHRFAVQI